MLNPENNQAITKHRMNPIVIMSWKTANCQIHTSTLTLQTQFHNYQITILPPYVETAEK